MGEQRPFGQVVVQHPIVAPPFLQTAVGVVWLEAGVNQLQSVRLLLDVDVQRQRRVGVCDRGADCWPVQFDFGL